MVKSCNLKPDMLTALKPTNALLAASGFAALLFIVVVLVFVFSQVPAVNPPSMVTFAGMLMALSVL
jgi:hypothetical protein